MPEEGAIDRVKCGGRGRHGVTLLAAPAVAGSSWASRSGRCCLAASSRSRSFRQAADQKAAATATRAMMDLAGNRLVCEWRRTIRRGAVTTHSAVSPPTSATRAAGSGVKTGPVITGSTSASRDGSETAAATKPAGHGSSGMRAKTSINVAHPRLSPNPPPEHRRHDAGPLNVGPLRRAPPPLRQGLRGCRPPVPAQCASFTQSPILQVQSIIRLGRICRSSLIR